MMIRKYSQKLESKHHLVSYLLYCSVVSYKLTRCWDLKKTQPRYTSIFPGKALSVSLCSFTVVKVRCRERRVIFSFLESPCGAHFLEPGILFLFLIFLVLKFEN